MSIETHFLLRKDRPGLRDLDDVVLLADVPTIDGAATLAAGTEGTVIGILPTGDAYLIEFPEPAGALAAVESGLLLRVEPAQA